MKERYSLYLSDITDGFHIQCFASIVFLYFACVTPIVTFGGLLGQATDGWMVRVSRTKSQMETQHAVANTHTLTAPKLTCLSLQVSLVLCLYQSLSCFCLQLSPSVCLCRSLIAVSLSICLCMCVCVSLSVSSLCVLSLSHSPLLCLHLPLP